MSDDFYRKQLEAFGIESVRVTPGDVNKKRDEERREATTNIIKMLMDRIEGRQWIYSLLDMGNVFTSPFVPGKPDVSTFLSGAQAFAHKILSDVMQAAPEKFYEMVSEEQTRRKAFDKPDI